MPELPSNPWTGKIEEILASLEVDPERGLSHAAVKERRHRHGANLVKQKKRKSVWTVLLNQFESVIVLLLAAAAAATFIVGRWVEGIAISVVVVFNALIGFLTELRAVRSMEALEKLSQFSGFILRGRPEQDVFRLYHLYGG